MAIHVEDHPIEYLDFEGTIPRGEYGAGDAIVWDWGTYEPEAPTLDPGRSIADGELKFRIFGQKLRGRFTLVRTRGIGRGGRRASRPAEPESDRDGEPWLLIHKQDADAVAGWDRRGCIRPSVRTGRTNEEVAAGRRPRFEAPPPVAVPTLEAVGAVAGPFPGFIEPMLATLATRRSTTRTGCSRSSGTATGSRPSSATAGSQPLHPKRQGCRLVLPGPAQPARLDRCPRGGRRRRGRRARRRRAGRTSACSRSGSG